MAATVVILEREFMRKAIRDDLNLGFYNEHNYLFIELFDLD